MTPEEMARKLGALIVEFDTLIAEMNDRGKACACCGLGVRENMDDFKGKEGLQSARQKCARMLGKLLDGTWQGRALTEGSSGLVDLELLTLGDGNASG